MAFVASQCVSVLEIIFLSRRERDQSILRYKAILVLFPNFWSSNASLIHGLVVL